MSVSGGDSDWCFVVRRGHYELAVNARAHRRVAAAFTELARVISREADRNLVSRG